MTLHLYTLSRDRPSDFKILKAIARIHFAAWMTLPLNQKIYYGAEKYQSTIIKKYLDVHTNSLQNEPACRLVVLMDDELEEETAGQEENPAGRSVNGEKQISEGPRGRVIAAIKYYIVPGEGPHPDSGTQEVIDNPNQPVHESPYENEALANAFVGPMVGARKNLMATLGSHLCVDNLYTDPSQQRRGAGGILMRHACKEADALGLPAMLESSPVGLKLYEGVGFRKAEVPGAEIWIDLKRWENGGDKGQKFEDDRLRVDPSRKDGWYLQIMMIRPAKMSDGGKP